MRVLGVTDSDSYIKWGAAIVDRMPADWQTNLVVIRTPALPSESQRVSALSGTRFGAADVPLVDLADLARLVADEQPDVVLLSVRGPVVRVLVRMIDSAMPHRPVIVSGLPGISIPETMLALYYRSRVDLMLLHSKREITAFSALAASLGIEQDFGLATLPFLTDDRGSSTGGGDIVFAAQAKVPATLSDRLLVMQWLAETARRHPESRVVVKLRGVAGEAQTHSERYPFDVILEGMTEVPENLVVSTGPMAEHLERASALVTVSSTAAIEAIAAGVPVLAIDDFGVTARLINLVFEGSGLLAGSDALISGDFRHPDATWLDENYFHPLADETWITAIEAAVVRRESGAFPLRPQFRATVGGNLRRIWDRKRALGQYDTTLGGYAALAVGLPLRWGVRRLRAVRARLRGPADTSSRPALERVR